MGDQPVASGLMDSKQRRRERDRARRAAMSPEQRALANKRRRERDRARRAAMSPGRNLSKECAPPELPANTPDYAPPELPANTQSAYTEPHAPISEGQQMQEEYAFMGSFQELLMNATAGALNFGVTEELMQGGPSLHERDDDVYLGGQEGIPLRGQEGDDEGYLGGHEGDDDTYLVGHEGILPEDIETTTNASLGVFEAHNGLDVESDSEIDTERTSLEGDLSAARDCNPEGDTFGSDNEDGSCGDSDSSDSEDEDDVTIKVDVQQEIYIDKDQIGVPYRKRKRAPKHVKRPNCRPPRGMGAIERALRAAPTRKTEFIFEPVLGMVFDSRHEAREFYNNYSWEVGFGVKFNTSRPGAGGSSSGKKVSSSVTTDGENEEPYRNMQEIACQRAGFDSRETDGSKRCGCPAKIRLLRTDDHAWYISSFEKNHNHEFSRTDAQKREWNSHKQIEAHMRDTIKDLRDCNINLTRVHCILCNLFGKKGGVTWTKRSLRTVCNQIARDKMDDDIRKTMEIFREMREKDPGFQFSVELDKRSRIRTLLWCSGRGRDQYECFGDVVTFDTTYCTNIYKMPFGLFVGVNNHFQTTIFGGVLMRRETTKSFKWVFKEFLKLMGGKAPFTILTDQCKAMTKAIRIMMPNTYHLWCKWHVMKKIRECLGKLYTKNKKFRDEFWLVVNGMLSEDEFESAWGDLIKKYKLENNGFMNRIYKCKEKWAKPWSKDKFCARMCSTQRSESANFMLKQYVPRNSTMNHFVSQYSQLLYERDREEDIAEEKTRQLKMVHSQLWPIERHALTVYTKAAFELFRAEVAKARNFTVAQPIGNISTVSHNDAEKRTHWQRVHFKVEVIEGGKKYVCECGLYEHFGILCCHALRVMLRDDVPKIPDDHIMKRWTRSARDVIPEREQKQQKDKDAIQSSTFRHRLMRKNNEELVTTADTDVELFEIVMKHMKAAKKEAAELIAKRAENAEVLQDEDSSDDEVECEGDDVQHQGVGFQSDGEVLIRQKQDGKQEKNRYGASGSSAHYSDTEIVNLKAPAIRKVNGRPTEKRFMSSYEKSKRKWKKKKNKQHKGKSGVSIIEYEEGLVSQPDLLPDASENLEGTENCRNKSKKPKRVIKCGKCGLEGHNAVQCCNLEITEGTAGRYL